QAVHASGSAVNVGAWVGHTALRAAVMPDLSQAATDAQIKLMSSHLDAAMQEGALGMSSGLFYKPAEGANLHEMTSLARVVGHHGGVYVTHLRTEMDDIIAAMHEAAQTAKVARTPWILSHHKCAGPKNWGRSIETLALLERLGQSQEVGLDAYPYTA
ncbi:MAG: D-aminoacylase, partial [Rhodoferax sp.]|nr:D-aminoacylase [Rhodoferax sp.]